MKPHLELLEHLVQLNSKTLIGLSIENFIPSFISSNLVWNSGSNRGEGGAPSVLSLSLLHLSLASLPLSSSLAPQGFSGEEGWGRGLSL